VATLFSDDFENASWTSSHWTRRAGSWVVSDGLYRMVGASGEYSVAYAGNASWRDYVVEARVRADSGDYSAQVWGGLILLLGLGMRFGCIRLRRVGLIWRGL
jgi:hypothetical protein